MKRLTPFVPLLLLAALLLSPAAALAGAKHGLELWWNSVFPALLPGLIAVRTAQGLGLLRLGSGHPRGKLVVVMGFSLASGAPNGAKLLHALVQDGSLSPQDAERTMPLVNSVSPLFLVSIIASELLKNKALFLPLSAGFYGVTLCLLVPRMLRHCADPTPAAPLKATPASFFEALSAAIEGGMLDMLRIGGCIILACTMLSLVHPLLSSPSLYAAVSGCMEVSTGVSAIAALSLSVRVKVGILTGVAAFGGMSLAMQTACCYPGLRMGPYLLRKLGLGVLTGGVSYLLFPLFPNVTSVFAGRQEVIQRSLSLSALLLSSLLSLAFMGVLGLMMSGTHTNPNIVSKE